MLVEANSPTPSIIIIAASLKGDGIYALAACERWCSTLNNFSTETSKLNDILKQCCNVLKNNL